ASFGIRSEDDRQDSALLLLRAALISREEVASVGHQEQRIHGRHTYALDHHFDIVQQIAIHDAEVIDEMFLEIRHPSIAQTIRVGPDDYRAMRQLEAGAIKVRRHERRELSSLRLRDGYPTVGAHSVDVEDPLHPIVLR